MSIRLYLDEDSMQHALVTALRARGMDVATALEDGMVDRADSEHLDHATRQDRVLFSFNRRDVYQLHSQYLTEGKSHAGIILARQQEYSTGEIMRRILRLAAAKSADAMQDQVEFLHHWR
jgi:predicted nuclease of predicted toxin-antitoxin system